MSETGIWIEVDELGIGWEVTLSPSDHSTVYGRDVTIRRQLPPEITNFTCRLCSHNSFEPIYYNPASLGGTDFGSNTVIGPGPNAGMPRVDKKWIIGYRCPNCTVHFEDPAKYSKNQPADVVSPVATPENEVWNIRYGLPRDYVSTVPPLDLDKVITEVKKKK